ncbi:MAG: ABC transporter substrate-binding protein, partial [Sulfuricaulis sp.]|nr:ABC transporter substrate-binding protein [Sulfuricaulis sp.]
MMYCHSRLQRISTKLRWFLAAGATVLAVGAVHAQVVQGVTDTEILLGSHVDLSGPIASVGVPVRDGLLFAAAEVNAAGGIHGRKLRILVEDNGYDPKKAVLVTQKLL